MAGSTTTNKIFTLTYLQTGNVYGIILPESEEEAVFEIDEYFKEKVFLRVVDAEKLGISRAVLSQMAKRGELQRMAQGVYARPDTAPDELALIGMRSANIVFSHETALNLHGLSNRIPAKPSITIPYGGSVPHSIASAVNAYRIRPQLHDIGRGTAMTFMGNEVACYDRERTICDIIRSYSRMDVETYANAIRNYAGSREKNIPQLVSYAQAMGIERKVLKVMEVLV